uniref:Uncharacterized protein n=1 Tax=Aegilops tauschii subsp. strangulata TaxID=200361 RepID=A0A453LMW0_AEGTS
MFELLIIQAKHSCLMHRLTATDENPAPDHGNPQEEVTSTISAAITQGMVAPRARICKRHFLEHLPPTASMCVVKQPSRRRTRRRTQQQRLRRTRSALTHTLLQPSSPSSSCHSRTDGGAWRRRQVRPGGPRGMEASSGSRRTSTSPRTAQRRPQLPPPLA